MHTGAKTGQIKVVVFIRADVRDVEQSLIAGYFYDAVAGLFLAMLEIKVS